MSDVYRVVRITSPHFKPGDKVRICAHCNGGQIVDKNGKSTGVTIGSVRGLCRRCKGSGFDPLRSVK
jgi:DnaJ-class molecular chaperone